MDIKKALTDAYNLYYSGQYKESLKLYYKILSENLDNSVSYYSIGLVYDVLGEYEMSAAYYKKSIALDSGNVRSLNNLARIYIDVIKDFDIAKTYLEQAIKYAPQDAEAYNLYGNLWILNNDYKLAINYFKKSILLDEKYFKNYYDIGLAYWGLKDKDNAIKNVKKSLELNPQFTQANNLLQELL